MASRAQQKLKDSGYKGKPRRNNDSDGASLAILRLDLDTVTEQIKMLESELDMDPCLCTDGTATILSQVETLKQELKKIRVRIKQLKAVGTGASPNCQSDISPDKSNLNNGLVLAGIRLLGAANIRNR